MPKDNSRTRRVGEQLQRQLAIIFQNEITDPRLKMLTVAAVKPSNDLSSARVYYTLLDDSHRADAQAALDNASGHIRYLLKDHIDMRIIPKLRFVYDESIRYGSDLSALINKAVSSDAQKRHAPDDNDANEGEHHGET